MLHLTVLMHTFSKTLNRSLHLVAESETILISKKAASRWILSYTKHNYWRPFIISTVDLKTELICIPRAKLT